MSQSENLSLLIFQIEHEILAVEVLQLHATEELLLCKPHLARLCSLAVAASKALESNETLIDFMITQKLVKESDRHRLKEITDKTDYTNVVPYDSALSSQSFLLRFDDIEWALCAFRGLHRVLEKKAGSSHSIFTKILSSPTVMLSLLLPFLVYAVFYVYTHKADPRDWFKNGLDDFSIESAQQGWGRLGLNKSVLGKPLTIGGIQFDKGLGTHSNSRIILSFKKPARVFSGACGVDSEVGKKGSIQCAVRVDGKIVYQSEILRGGEVSAPFIVKVEHVNSVELLVGDAGDGLGSDHADWVELAIR
jgi:hypothetical protein